ncbi:MAG TPA: hypothetical protein VHG28_16185 [Longimicrobiaceae bacterium]|nr:hypothetical protein [Longimicrobiaceae bacterium]
MLIVIEWSLDNIPDEAKPHAWRTILAMFSDVFERAGVPVPDWVRIGQERWGRL